MIYHNEHGEILRQRREEAGLTPEETAQALGIGCAEWLSYETGEADITPQLILKLTKIFRVDLASLLPHEKCRTIFLK